MTMKPYRRVWPGFMFAALAAFAAAATLSCRAPRTERQNLEAEFLNPPASAKPWVYWFWLNGNLTREGITADLEAMKRVGIGGVLIMEVDQGAPAGPAAFGGPVWRDLFKHVCSEAARLGLEVNMNNDAGWCGSGGPWITPELSMQKLVWTETAATGPGRFKGTLEKPQAVMDYYGDIAVVALPRPAGNARITDLAEKAAYVTSPASLFTLAGWPDDAAGTAVRSEDVVELTSQMDKDGRLTWDVPAGQWTILRIGHTTTGKDNHPAPEPGRGLECDKLNPDAAAAHYAGLMGRLVADIGPLAGPTLVATHIDSWEVGSQNWTARFREEFERRRGYNLVPWYPVMTGRIVGTVERSERFLWDIRQTVNELLLENYAAKFRDLAHRDGLKLTIEAYGAPCDEMAYAGRADEPMGEFWSWTEYAMAYSCTAMASAAHVYGRPVVGAEAFTATDAERWLGHPAVIKALGDWAFCEGINRFVFHRYAMQPWLNVKPGMSMGPWGLHYERTQTWWEQSAAWHAHLARCQYLLRQGLFVADVCYLTPEGSPQTLAEQRRFLAAPGDALTPRERTGYSYDTCPAEVVITRMSVKDGRLVLPDGMSYRLLVLPAVETMTPELLGRIAELVKAGAAVAGTRPVKSPSLAGYPECDREVARRAGALFGSGPAPTEITERRVGRGRVFWGGGLVVEKKPPIGLAETLGPARWIWRAEGNPAVAVPPGKRFFRKIVTVEGSAGDVESARLLMTADNAFTCWVGGVEVASGSDFRRVVEANVAPFLKPGENVVAVAATNGTDTPNPAGLIGALVIRYRDGRVETAVTDATWQAAERVGKGWPAGDEGAATASGSWSPAVEVGPLGMEPWGAVDQPPHDTALFPEDAQTAEVLAKMGVGPDFEAKTKSGSPALRWIHRSAAGAEIYFVANKTARDEDALCSFRVRGMRPELWRPETGSVERPAVYEVADGVVRMPLHFEPAGSVFVVFREKAEPESSRIARVTWNGREAGEPTVDLRRGRDARLEAEVRAPGAFEFTTASGKSGQFRVESLPEPVAVDGPWQVSFAAGGGASESAVFDKLISWSDHTDAGIRYYSGPAVYAAQVEIADGLIADGRRFVLDLGDVEVMARVSLNGKDLGIAWKPPYQVDVTEALRPGKNELKVAVVNLWVNRQIGDEMLPEDSDRNPDGTLKAWPEWLLEGKASPTGRLTFTSWRLWHKGDALRPSGLLGPVRIVASERRTLD